MRAANGLFSNIDFEDRNIERKALGDFLDHKSNTSMLWVNGVRGCGKSYLVKHVIDLCDADSLFVFAPANELMKDGDYLKRFQNACLRDKNLPLSQFLKNNYESFFDIGVAAAKGIVKTLLDFDIDDFLDSTAGIGKLFVDRRNETENIAGVMARYLKKRADSKHLIVIFDNFSSCDAHSLDVIKQVVLSDKNSFVKFIVVTTSEDLRDNLTVREFLEEAIPVDDQSVIEPFSDPIHFQHMLTSGFECDNGIVEVAKLLHSVCEGKPQLLVEVIRNLYDEHASDLRKNDHLHLPSEMMRKSVVNNSCELGNLLTKPRSIQSMSSFEQAILRTICMLAIPVNQDVLQNMMIYICDRMGMTPVSQIALGTAMDNLLFDGILCIDPCTSSVEFTHDIDHIYYDSIFKMGARGNRRYFSSLIALYLLSDSSEFGKISSYDRFNLIAEHSYNGGLDNWIEINRSYAKARFTAGDNLHACSALSRLYEDPLYELSDEEMVMLLESSFETGDYEKCVSIGRAKKTSINTFSGESLARAKHSIGKAAHLMLNVEEACDNMKSALQATKDSRLRYLISGCLISALRSSDNGEEEAKHLFLDIADDVINLETFDVSEYDLSLCGVLRNASFFLENEKAERVLKRCVSIARHHGSLIEEAFALNNIGVVEIKRGWYPDAKATLEKAAKTLYRLKPFEAAYPLQNLSTVFLFENRPDKALNVLDAAKRWARSTYINDAIQTNTIAASLIKGSKQKIRKLANELYRETFESDLNHDLIIRGNYINLAIAFEQLGEIEKAKMCIEEGLRVSENTNSEYRCVALSNRIAGTCLDTPTPRGETDFYNTLSFDPFLISIAHG